MKPSKIKVQAEYRSTGIFITAPRSLAGEIDHSKLGISKELSEKIFEWIETYDSWLNWEDPASSEKISEEVIEKFNSRGREIMEDLREELGDKIKINYKAV